MYVYGQRLGYYLTMSFCVLLTNVSFDWHTIIWTEYYGRNGRSAHVKHTGVNKRHADI